MKKVSVFLFLAGLVGLLGCNRGLKPVTPPDVTEERPAITDLAPREGFTLREGFQPTVVKITGSLLEGGTVRFFGSQNDAEIVACEGFCVVVPADAQTGPVVVTVGEVTVQSGMSFEVIDEPELDSVSPDSGFGQLISNPLLPGVRSSDCTFELANGTDGPCLRIITLQGDGFDATANTNNRVTLGGVPLVVYSAERRTLRVIMPQTAVTGELRVETPAGADFLVEDFIVPGSPTVQSLAPFSLAASSAFTLRATELDRFTLGNHVVRITVTNGVTTTTRNATVTGVSPAAISAIAPSFSDDEVAPGALLQARVSLATPGGESTLASQVPLSGRPVVLGLVVNNGTSTSPTPNLNEEVLSSVGAAVTPLRTNSMGQAILYPEYAGAQCPVSRVLSPQNFDQKIGSRVFVCGRGLSNVAFVELRSDDGSAFYIPQGLLIGSTIGCAAGTQAIEVFPDSNVAGLDVIVHGNGDPSEVFSSADVVLADLPSVSYVTPSLAMRDNIVRIVGSGFIDHLRAQAVVWRSALGDRCLPIVYVHNQQEIAVRIPADLGEEPGQLVIKHGRGEVTAPLTLISGRGHLLRDVYRPSVGLPPTDHLSRFRIPQDTAPPGYGDATGELYDFVRSPDGRYVYASASVVEREVGLTCAIRLAPDDTPLQKLDTLTNDRKPFDSAPCSANQRVALSADGTRLAAYSTRRDLVWDDASPFKVFDATTRAQVSHFAIGATGFLSTIEGVEPSPSMPNRWALIGVSNQVSETSLHTLFVLDSSASPATIVAQRDLDNAELGVNTAFNAVEYNSYEKVFQIRWNGDSQLALSFLRRRPASTCPSVEALVRIYDVAPGSLMPHAGPMSQRGLWGFNGSNNFARYTGAQWQSTDLLGGNLLLGPLLDLPSFTVGLAGLTLVDAVTRPLGSGFLSVLRTAAPRSSIDDCFGSSAFQEAPRYTPRLSEYDTTTASTRAGIVWARDTVDRAPVPMTDASARLFARELQGRTVVQEATLATVGGSLNHPANPSNPVLSRTAFATDLVGEITTHPLADALSVSFAPDGTLYVGDGRGGFWKRAHGQPLSALTPFATLTNGPAPGPAGNVFKDCGVGGPFPPKQASTFYEQCAIRHLLVHPGTGDLYAAYHAENTSANAALIGWWLASVSPSGVVTELGKLQISGNPFMLEPFIFAPMFSGIVLPYAALAPGMYLYNTREARFETLASPLVFGGMALAGDRPSLVGGVDNGGNVVVGEGRNGVFSLGMTSVRKASEGEVRATQLRDLGAASVLNGRAMFYATQSNDGLQFLIGHTDLGGERAPGTGTSLLSATECGALANLGTGVAYPLGCLTIPTTTYERISPRFVVSADGRRAYFFAQTTEQDTGLGAQPWCLHVANLDEGKITIGNLGVCGGKENLSGAFAVGAQTNPTTCRDPNPTCRPSPSAFAISPAGDELVYITSDFDNITEHFEHKLVSVR